LGFADSESAEVQALNRAKRWERTPVKYSRNDEFPTPLSSARARKVLAEHFIELRFSVKDLPNGLEIRAGSGFIFRCLGFLAPRSIPIGLTVQLERRRGGTTVKAKASDRLGRYLSDRKFSGTEQALNGKLAALLNESRTALGVDERRSAAGAGGAAAQA
jgi:hypothetical protein